MSSLARGYSTKLSSSLVEIVDVTLETLAALWGKRQASMLLTDRRHHVGWIWLNLKEAKVVADVGTSEKSKLKQLHETSKNFVRESILHVFSFR